TRELLGRGQQFAGFTLRDLTRVDMSKPVPPDLELVAEILLNQNQNYRPAFFQDSYDDQQQRVFGDLTRSQLAPALKALTVRYAVAGEYASKEVQLRTLLAQAGIDPQDLRDPWGTAYRPVFTVDQEWDTLNFLSAGADKRFDTADDFTIEGSRWAYFRPLGEAIDRAVHAYHQRTGGFIRDFDTLRAETGKEGFRLDTLRDRWGQPYRIVFDVDRTSYVIKFSTSGPNRRFEDDDAYGGDDFVIWTSQTDYFIDTRSGIEAVLREQLKRTNKFPQNERELAEALRNSGLLLENLRDPWSHPYYATFGLQYSYFDRLRFESRGRFGESPVQQTQVTPVTSKAVVIYLRSAGADGKPGTFDDFDVARFTGVVAEQSASE